MEKQTQVNKLAKELSCDKSMVFKILKQTDYTYGVAKDHLQSILENDRELQGKPFSEVQDGQADRSASKKKVQQRKDKSYKKTTKNGQV